MKLSNLFNLKVLALVGASSSMVACAGFQVDSYEGHGSVYIDPQPPEVIVPEVGVVELPSFGDPYGNYFIEGRRVGPRYYPAHREEPRRIEHREGGNHGPAPHPHH